MSLQAYRNLRQVVTLEGAFKKDGRNLVPEDLGTISNAAVVTDGERIVWVGEERHFPEEYASAEMLDMAGAVMLPEIVDSHTHLIFGGNRSHEYSQRLNGATYQQIAARGGGILSTVKATRASREEELYESACQRIERMHARGVGTIEIKSGYALNREGEKGLARLIDRLKKQYAPRIQIFNTFMAAHAVPPESSSSQHYLREVCLPLMGELAQEGLVDAVDIFHEQGYFDTNDVEELCKAATKLGLPLKIHADEFADHGGASLAVKYAALSCDHLLCTSAEGIRALANSSTVATLLPGTGFFLGKPQAPAARFLAAGCKVALASDYNPGSCHWDDLLSIANLAGPNLGMNQAQLWAGITLNAAHALGLSEQGAIQTGLCARFSFFECASVDEITYFWGRNLARKERKA